MVNSEDFGKRLQKIMEEHDLNATSFADAIEVGRSSISHILSGRNKPSLDFVLKVVESFPDVGIYWLLNGKGTYPNYDTPEKHWAKAKKPEPQNPAMPNLFDEQVRQPSVPLHHNNTNQDIERIVIFYKDGRFKSFLP